MPVVCQYKKANVHTFEKGVVLTPGPNVLSDELAEKMQAHPGIKRLVKAGVVKFEGEVTEAETGEKVITGVELSDDEIIDTILESTNIFELGKYAEDDEASEAVKAAAAARLEELQPTEADRRTETATEDA